MGISLIIAGFVFLANPNFNIIDIFPDFIGLFLVYLGLVKFSHISQDLNGAKNIFLALAGVEVLKFLAIGMISGSDITWYLLLSFTFGVVECIMFFYSAVSFFDGIERLGVKYNSEFVLKTYNSIAIVDRSRRFPSFGRVKKDVITKAKNSVIIFYFVRTVCATLPEFTQIIKESAYVDYTLFRPALYLLGAFICIIWSVFYLIRVISFLVGIKKDKAFMSALITAHGEFEGRNINYRTSRRMLIALVMYSLAIISTVNLGDDGLSLIPLIIPALFLISSSLLMAKDDRRSLLVLIPAVPLCVLSVYNYMQKSAFYEGSTEFADIFHFEKYMDKFLPISNTNMLGQILLLLSFGVCVYVMFGLMMQHVDWDRKYIGMSENRINEITLENKATVLRYRKLHSILLGIVLIMNALYPRLALLFGSFDTPETSYEVYVPGAVYQIILIAVLILTGVLFVSSRQMRNFAKERIYNVEYAWSVYEENKE